MHQNAPAPVYKVHKVISTASKVHKVVVLVVLRNPVPIGGLAAMVRTRRVNRPYKLYKPLTRRAERFNAFALLFPSENFHKKSFNGNEYHRTTILHKEKMRYTRRIRRNILFLPKLSEETPYKTQE